MQRRVTWDEAARAYVEAFESVLGLKLHKGEMSRDEITRADELVRVKYAQPAWTEK